ncbi:efflux RND transporter periplasmic adaptor subunit [Lichenihabitans sp. PAMC28606]|uniref:efflux RND transporter periplasmic adaptor subunit n=1 Tax=Lichenihabitans sp. PAMC28606 TaxID=2880932 RepID=UPI001D0B41E2|nr:efflux RND transporter periplasmic adaptor subunit [Lichenihabitans sp. PAMC28606]UDL96241.1 efflux RND transporter periplasmic adaptor subunit [Lichenihabitans sp. PAMC28606]
MGGAIYPARGRANGWATQQNADQTRLTLSAQNATLASAQADVAVATANVEAQTATVQQLQELTSFEAITAPFDGIVTERNVDKGDLINGSASGGTAMFVLQRDDVLRVHIDVPQSASVGLEDGLAAQVTQPERPAEVFTGAVARHAGSLSVGSRTMPTEVDVANGDHRLQPCLFVHVSLSIPQGWPTVTVPAGAILLNGQGLRVATIDRDGSVRMHEVDIYRDFGTSVERRNSLHGGERVAVNPPANLQAGDKVRIAPVSAETAPAGASPDKPKVLTGSATDSKG